MSFKKSCNDVNANKSVWKKNLPAVSKQKRDPTIPLIEEISTLTRIPTNRQILGNFAYLINREKRRSDRIKMIIADIKILWGEVLNFPVLSEASIKKKLNHLINLNDTNKRRPSEKFSAILSQLFDVTKMDGAWKSSEDQELHNLQLRSGGKIGYSTLKEASLKSVHPRRRAHVTTKTEPSPFDAQLTDDSISQSDDDSVSTLLTSSSECEPRYKRRSTTTASLLVRKNSISTNKAHDVLATLSEHGYNVPVPSQSGIWRRVIREGRAMKLKIIKKLENRDPYCLQFDGKRIQGEEYQVALLKNVSTEIKLGVVRCKSGSAKDIYNELNQLIDDYNAWKNIGMIICDTTAVNTGSLKGIVKLIQDDVTSKGFRKPQYIGCQHHVLDLILKHVMNFAIQEETINPDINYSFIEEISKNYVSLQNHYNEFAIDNDTEEETPGWRDDFKFLYSLCNAYRHYKATSKWLRIKWGKLPNLHQARWNSRAIYAVTAFLLLPDWRCLLGITCDFISYEWATAWFQNQHYNKNTFNELLAALHKTNCKRAIKCLKTHWKVDESMIDIPRSNQVAERAIKLMEELHKNSKNVTFLNMKFIGKNNL